jgi:hypothetical protein
VTDLNSQTCRIADAVIFGTFCAGIA